MLDLDAIRKRAQAATPGDIYTAGITLREVYTFPVCDGEGEVDGNQYLNCDGAPLNVLFFGTGDQIAKNEALYTQARADILALLDELERTRAAAKSLRHTLDNVLLRDRYNIKILDITKWLEEVE